MYIDFAILKASEGSAHVDPRFAENWRAATSTHLRVGAYHFVSFESDGAAQAEHVIAVVPVRPGGLPPALDLELYGRFRHDPPTAARVHEILDPLVARLEEHYAVAPIIYVTRETYEGYVRGAYPRNPIWIRSVITPPRLADGRPWTLWQYSNRDRLPGYQGSERFIDMNVFAGSREQFAELAVPPRSAHGKHPPSPRPDPRRRRRGGGCRNW